jgi:hypothetical protein
LPQEVIGSLEYGTQGVEDREQERNPTPTAVQIVKSENNFENLDWALLDSLKPGTGSALF